MQDTEQKIERVRHQGNQDHINQDAPKKWERI